MAFMFPAGQFTLKQGNPDATVIFCTDDEYFEKLLWLDMVDRLSINQETGSFSSCLNFKCAQISGRYLSSKFFPNSNTDILLTIGLIGRIRMYGGKMEAFHYLFSGSLLKLKSSCDFTENQIIPDHIVDWGIAISGFGFFRRLYSNTFESQPKNVVRKYFEFQPK